MTIDMMLVAILGLIFMTACAHADAAAALCPATLLSHCTPHGAELFDSYLDSGIKDFMGYPACFE